MLFKDYIETWFKVYKLPIISKETGINGLRNIKNHISCKEIGQKELTDITTMDCQILLKELLICGNKQKLKNFSRVGQPLASRTVVKIRQMLIAAFNQAKKENLILKNPAEDTSPLPISQNNQTVMSIFTINDQQYFLKHTQNSRYYAAYLLLFFSGCRRGEILGLSWENINWKDECIYIKQSLIMENGEPKLKKGTKTIKSIRTIPIPHEIKLALRKVYIRQKNERNNNKNYNNPYNLVFATKIGSLPNPQYFSRNFKNKIKRLGLTKGLHIHSTRHTWATNMVQIGIPISDIQSLGGWSRPDVLLNIYAHSVQKTHKKAINKLFKIVNKEIMPEFS